MRVIVKVKMTSIEERIQVLKDQFYDIVAEKMYRFIEGKGVVSSHEVPFTQWDMSNLSKEQFEFIVEEISYTTCPSFQSHYHEAEEFEWLFEEEYIDDVVELLNKNENNRGMVFKKVRKSRSSAFQIQLSINESLSHVSDEVFRKNNNIISCMW